MLNLLRLVCSCTSEPLNENPGFATVGHGIAGILGCFILCCCDGLSLLWGYSAGYLLRNPSTNESVQLPNHGFSALPSFNTHHGLGYDAISDDYKIFMVCCDVFASRPPNKILALKSGSWKGIDNHPAGCRG
ncbi:hypothetical protein P3S67_017155 [Capsicum chacoense]